MRVQNRTMILTRRALLATAAAGVACARTTVRLAARPTGTANPGPGVRALGVRKNRDAQLYVPEAVAKSGKPAPLLMYLHGATGNEQQGIKRLGSFADTFGFILLSPASADGTWDAIRNGYGADVKALDEALAKAFELCTVDPKLIGVCGFSDGASYALGLGLANGELFKSVMAYSPGFIPPPFEPSGKPRVFISHGTQDQILPIKSCSRVLVPELKQRGYAVTYREFEGPHAVPKPILEEAMPWFLSQK